MSFRIKTGKHSQIVTESSCGRFEMKYNDNDISSPEYEYRGYVIWKSQSDEYRISAEVQCDSEDSFDASNGFEILEEILSDSAALEDKLKNYIFSQLSHGEDTVAIWGSSEQYEKDVFIQPVSYSEFTCRIKVYGIYIHSDGSYEFFIDLDNMFTDFCYDIFSDENGNIISGGLSKR